MLISMFFKCSGGVQNSFGRSLLWGGGGRGGRGIFSVQCLQLNTVHGSQQGDHHAVQSVFLYSRGFQV